jgi:hypothetical protein
MRGIAIRFRKVAISWGSALIEIMGQRAHRNCKALLEPRLFKIAHNRKIAGGGGVGLTSIPTTWNGMDESGGFPHKSTLPDCCDAQSSFRDGSRPERFEVSK